MWKKLVKKKDGIHSLAMCCLFHLLPILVEQVFVDQNNHTDILQKFQILFRALKHTMLQIPMQFLSCITI